MVDEAIDGSDSHGWIHKDVVPGTEGMIGCNHEAFEFIAVGNQFKQNGGLGFRLFDVAEIIKDEQVKLIQL